MQFWMIIRGTLYRPSFTGRMINLICSQALYDAKQRNNDVIEESHIIRVLTDLDRQRGVIA
ncbi:MAG: hypothetical protein DDT30_01900 [Dehalococcoidia bacterium]|nr:hypothetical protein [Bacillota bacterium]MBT9141311.1 hypothetical protein [Bacillota bacterium]